MTTGGIARIICWISTVVLSREIGTVFNVITTTTTTTNETCIADLSMNYYCVFVEDMMYNSLSDGKRKRSRLRLWKNEESAPQFSGECHPVSLQN